MNLRCNLCVSLLSDNASVQTDDLYLDTYDGHDYLTCEFHHGGQYDRSKRVFAGNTQSVSQNDPSLG